MKATMKQLSMNAIRLLAGACVVTVLLALAPAGHAQQGAATPSAKAAPATQQAAAPAAKPAAAPVAEEESAAPNSANQQGIKVHGHWVLQVKNADGTLGERREFDNSLVTDDQSTSGDQLLAGLLSGNLTAGDPTVVLIQIPPGASGSIIFSQVCNLYLAINGQINGCWPITTSDNTIAAQWFSTSLSISSETGLTATTYWSSPVKWVLSGNYTVPSGLTSITHVETLLDICHPITPNYGPSASPSGTSGGRNADISPRTCTSSNTSNTEATLFGTLTATAVQSGSTPAPLAVTAGQIVQVTVTISFS